MGSFDGAETCELVGAYLLSQLSAEYGNDIGLKITIEANKKCVNYLDITLDLRSSTYKPFMKPGNTPLYVNYDSNHPPSVLRGLPDAINKRLSNISSDRRSFDSAAPPYKEALKKSGFDCNLKYNPQPPKQKRHRNRNVIWFNPPYSVNVATKSVKRFTI